MDSDLQMIDIIHKGSTSFFIDDDGRDHVIPLFSTSRYIAEGKFTVKINGFMAYRIIY